MQNADLHNFDDQAPAPLFLERPLRHRTCLKGVLVYHAIASTKDEPFTLECAIHDLSEGGARIALHQREPLPRIFFLIIVKYCVAYRAELRWMAYPARGLQFCGVYPMNLALPHDAIVLRKVWADLHERDGHGPAWVGSH